MKAELARQLYHSAKEASAWVKTHFSVEYSERGLEDLLGRLDFTFHKVRLVPSHADVQAQETFIQEYQQTRADLQSPERLYFMDGVHPMHNVQPGSGWAPRGQRVCLPSNRGRRRYNMLGLYCPLDGQSWDEQTTDSLNAQTVIALGEKVRQAHPASVRHIIYCDNVRYQHAKLVREHFANTNVEFRFLPPYAPNLNLIERLWKFLKAQVLRQYYATFEEFVQAIQDFLSPLDRYADELASLMTERFEILSPVT